MFHSLFLSLDAAALTHEPASTSRKQVQTSHEQKHRTLRSLTFDFSWMPLQILQIVFLQRPPFVQLIIFFGIEINFLRENSSRTHHEK